MAPWLFAIVSGVKRTLVTPPPFTANATWVAPITTNSLATLVGKGGPGSPSSTTYTYDRVTTQYLVRRDGTGTESQVVMTTVGIAGHAPADYCDAPVATPQSLDYSSQQNCYTHTEHSNTNPATTGPSATGFGKTFPGGTGRAATPVTYNNVAVTPGASYNLIVPSGGSITITYYQ